MPLQVHITYRKTSRLSMRLAKDGSLHVSAPWGYSRQRIEAFVRDNQTWVARAQARQNARMEQQNDFYSHLLLNTAAEKAQAKLALLNIVEPLIRQYSSLMKVTPQHISFRASKSRWGSCQPKTGSICLSLYLLLLPDWCIEHVVVHEMTHLLVPNHSPAFYRQMDIYFPRWREARLYTRQLMQQPSAR